LAGTAFISPRSRSSRPGRALSLTFLGVVIGPPLFSAVVTATGSYRPAFFAAALAAAAAALTLRRR
jgi:MFS family permease